MTPFSVAWLCESTLSIVSVKDEKLNDIFTLLRLIKIINIVRRIRAEML